MNAPATELVYESQSDPRDNRNCGVACLRMVYRAFGKDIPPEQIWRAIAKQNSSGSIASTTHLMAQDAQAQGLAAAIIRVRYPLQALHACRELGIHAILNHRLNRNAGTGHYSVLVDIDKDRVVLHDPLYGPSHSIPHAELLELWQPGPAGGEIAGHVLIGIAGKPQPAGACRFCKTPFPAEVECPNCRQKVTMQPATLFGCVGESCVARMWSRLYCPSCDFSWTFNVPAPMPSAAGAPAAGAAAKAPAASEKDPWNLGRLFGEMDSFHAQLLKSPAVANHPEMQKLLGLIEGQKSKLYLAQAEMLSVQTMQQAKFDRMREAAEQSKQAIEQKREAQRQRKAERNAASPPLDPDALRVALLKNLGWTK